MSQSFKARIASINTIAVVIVMAFVFVVIYLQVHHTSFQHLDDDLRKEKVEVFQELDRSKDHIFFHSKFEQDELEHHQMEANPTFLQIVDANDVVIYKSANLGDSHFSFMPKNLEEQFYSADVSGQKMRFAQFPIINDAGQFLGFLTIGTSAQEAYVVLEKLLQTLIFSYIFLIVVLSLVMWFAADGSIKPVKTLIAKAEELDENNLNQRLPLPKSKDEVYQLAQTINALLDKVETYARQQMQFTADISHEMRTPLTAIKGTLEVMLRRRREPEYYEEKLQKLLNQTNRLNYLYDQMLQLSKIDNITKIPPKEKIFLQPLLEKIKTSFSTSNHDTEIILLISEDVQILSNVDMLEIVLSNLISNALKYNKDNNSIEILFDEASVTLSIKDQGLGISENDLDQIFHRFYRADNSWSSTISGHGIGLYRVKKYCDLLSIHIQAKSKLGEGSTFSLTFPNR
ncbi:MAG: ATP-binding protein [Weeksellaceae bacterium]|nr:ATP-binding protein [Weeksellaceae bacterium]